MPAPKNPRVSPAQAPKATAKTPAKASSNTAAKADKPALIPLDEHLAALLNPALNRNRPKAVEPVPQPERARKGRGRKSEAGEAKAYKKIAQDGFAEVPQAGFAIGDAAVVDPRLAQALGLVPPDDGPAPEAGPESEAPSLATEGVSATVEALERLLTEGNPLFKNGEAWVPHRPERPAKSEGGVRFTLKSDFTPAGDQPRAIAELVAPRYADLAPGDPRPRLIGALAMASVRIALDDWLQHGGSLPQRVRTALETLSVG